MKEIERYIFGNDQNAINKHSVRIYEHNERKYVLDKTLDASPPFFTLYAIYTSKIPKIIKVLGSNYWGDGFSWKKAERIIRSYIS